jgi:hypothetical protein
LPCSATDVRPISLFRVVVGFALLRSSTSDFSLHPQIAFLSEMHKVKPADRIVSTIHSTYPEVAVYDFPALILLLFINFTEYHDFTKNNGSIRTAVFFNYMQY